MKRMTLALAAVPDAPSTTDAAARELTGLVVPYQVVAYRGMANVVFVPGGLALPDDLATVKLLVQHDDNQPAGYATSATEDDTGLRMTFHLPEHPRSDALLAEVDAGLRDAFSVGVEIDQATDDALWSAFMSEDPTPVPVTGALREVSSVSLPQFNDARASRAGAGTLLTFTTHPREATPMPETPTAVVERVDAPPVPRDQLPTVAELAAAVRDHLGSDLAPTGHPLAGFATVADYWTALDADPALRFALADQITTNNPGAIPPAWLTDLSGVIDQGRPSVQALGGARSLPATGMEVDWPYFDGDLTALVGAQATEKTQVTSVRVDLKKGTAAVATYAGGSDISYQLARRSSPSYVQAYLNILSAAYAATTEKVFSAAVYAAATLNVVVVAAATADQLRAGMFAASFKVFQATGRPATVCLAAPDIYAKWGALTGLYPAQYGTNNTAGTADAGTLSVNVSGLPVVLAPYLAAGTAMVTNDAAAAWYEDGPFIAAADDVSKLGTNQAVWGMGTTVARLPLGIIKITPT